MVPPSLHSSRSVSHSIDDSARYRWTRGRSRLVESHRGRRGGGNRASGEVWRTSKAQRADTVPVGGVEWSSVRPDLISRGEGGQVVEPQAERILDRPITTRTVDLGVRPAQGFTD